jgi:hypothetical protein
MYHPISIFLLFVLPITLAEMGYWYDANLALAKMWTPFHD